MKTFNPSFPTQIQRQDWTCSIRSTMMLLDSIGIDVTPDEAQAAMSPRYVTPAVGLLDASGAGLVEALRDHWGVEARNDGNATFDEVAAQAGKAPVAIGLRNWGGPRLGHWSAIRGFDGERLILANPGGTGPIYGQQTLTRAEFDARGPASMVFIPVAGTVDDGAAPADYPRGIDVSSHQGAIDWAAVAASGIAFAFNKFTEDEGYVNPYAAANWAGMKANGIVRGAYHFARPEVEDADDEARYFLDHVDAAGGLDVGDMVSLDMEAGSGDLGAWTLEFVRVVERRVGFRPIVYTAPWFSNPHELDLVTELAAYPLWQAGYPGAMTDPPTFPTPAEPWARVSFWQYTDKGRVPGIVGDVDMNVFNGPADMLKLYGKPVDQVPAVGVPDAPADDKLNGLISAVAYLADDVAAIEDREQRLAEARRVREQYVGPRPGVAA